MNYNNLEVAINKYLYGNVLNIILIFFISFSLLISDSAYSHAIKHTESDKHTIKNKHHNHSLDDDADGLKKLYSENHAKCSEHTDANNISDIERLIQCYSLIGDDNLLEQAKNLLATNDKIVSDEKLMLSIWIAQAEHKFNDALNSTEEIINRTPNNGQAWLLKANLTRLLGDFDSSNNACKKTVLSVSPLVAIACTVRTNMTKNYYDSTFAKNHNIKEFIPYTRKIEALLKTNHELEPNLNAWLLTTLGDLYKMQKNWYKAEIFYRDALKIIPSIQTYSALADTLFYQKDYQRMYEILPESTAPAIVVRKLLAKLYLENNISNEILNTDKIFQQWIENKDYRHAREMAMFYLYLVNDIEQAKQLAQLNIRFQKEPEDWELLMQTQNFSTKKFNM